MELYSSIKERTETHTPSIGGMRTKSVVPLRLIKDAEQNDSSTYKRISIIKSIERLLVDCEYRTR